jgi:hypothetical protein
MGSAYEIVEYEGTRPLLDLKKWWSLVINLKGKICDNVEWI